MILHTILFSNWLVLRGVEVDIEHHTFSNWLALGGVEADITHYTFSNWLAPGGVEVDVAHFVPRAVASNITALPVKTRFPPEKRFRLLDSAGQSHQCKITPQSYGKESGDPMKQCP